MGMLRDLLGEDDPFYQAIKRKDAQENPLQVMQHTAIKLVLASCADLEKLARTKIHQVDDMDNLQKLIIDLHLYLCRTREEMAHMIHERI